MAIRVKQLGERLTQKEAAWVDYFKQGNTGADAARLAGYKGNNHDNIGSENVRKLAFFIEDREKLLESHRIADMTEINEFWTQVIRNEDADLKERLKASELRAKVQGAFTEKHEVTVSESSWFK